MASTSKFNMPPKASTNRLAQFWRDLSLARKLLTAFGFLSILTLAVGIVSYLGLNGVQGSFEKALSEGQAMATISQHMQSDSLTARRHEKDFQRIAGAADKMDALLTDLLELSRVGRIVNPPEEVNLVILVQEALELLDARIRSKNVSVIVSPDLPTVYCDRLRLREVFENLITNAAKYMGDQPDPIIEIGTRNEKNEQLICVKDNGIGIEERYQSRVFTLFEKLNPTVEGTGIGLALVKRIIETHGGKIWVESEGLGKGSTFCFTIPDGRRQPI